MLAERVIAIIAEMKGREASEITTKSTFEELAIDSLDAVEIMFALEDQFDVEISDQDARSAVSVGQVVELLQARLDEGKAE